MSIGELADVSRVLASADLFRKALEQEKLESLYGLSAALRDPHAVAQLPPEHLQLFSEFLVESGRFESARCAVQRLLSDGAGDSKTASILLSRIARRTRLPITMAGGHSTLIGTNLWLDGMLSSALSSIETALLEDEENLDAQLLKALVLQEQGFNGEAQEVVDKLETARVSPLMRIEITALRIDLALDRGELDREDARFMAFAEIPNTPPDVELMVDLLRLPTAWRRAQLNQVSRIVSRYHQHDWVAPYVFAMQSSEADHSTVARTEMADQQSLRNRISFGVIESHDLRLETARNFLDSLLNEAECESLASPFIYFGNQVSALLIEILGSANGRFHHRLKRLVTNSKGTASPKLNLRETEIMTLFEAGLSARQIAEHLQISLQTVKSHSHHVVTKVGTQTRADALRQLKERGVLG